MMKDEYVKAIIESFAFMYISLSLTRLLTNVYCLDHPHSHLYYVICTFPAHTMNTKSLYYNIVY